MEENQNQNQEQNIQIPQTQKENVNQEIIAEVPEESVAIPKKSIIIFPTVILLIFTSVFAGFLLYQNIKLKEALKINSFEECAQAGGIIQTSYPTVCVTKDGRKFKEEIKNQETENPLPTFLPEINEENPSSTPSSEELEQEKVFID